MKRLIQTHWPYVFPLMILLTMVFLLLAFHGQQALAQEPAPTIQVYLPLILGQGDDLFPTPTPTGSPTPIVSPSPTPTISPTPTGSPTPTPTAPVTPGPLVAESVFGVNNGSLEAQSGLTETLNSGASWTHPPQVVDWAEVEPVEGQRNWEALANLETQVQAASSLGLRVALTVDNTPEWAHTSGISCGPVLPEKLPALASFLHDLVQRYRLDPYRVKTWELWSEADVAGDAGCWGDPSDDYYGGGSYAAMLKAVYPQIKAADPEAQVLVGGLRLECNPNNPPGGKDCAGSHFLEGILQADGGAFFDGISFHAADGFAVYDLPWGTAYQYSNYNWRSDWHTSGPVMVAKVNFIRALLSQYGVTGKALYNTQSAILCASCEAVPVFETAKASYIAQVYTTAISLGLKANLWESLTGWQNSGLMSPELTPLPAYQAFQFAREQIGPATYTGQLASSDVGDAPGIRGFKFVHEDGRQVWTLWYISVTDSSHAVTFAIQPTAAWDMLGKPLDLSNGLVVGVDPVYVEWLP